MARKAYRGLLAIVLLAAIVACAAGLYWMTRAPEGDGRGAGPSGSLRGGSGSGGAGSGSGSSETKHGGKGVGAVWERKAGDQRGTPQEPAPEKDFLAYYPKGRKVRSAAFFDIAGSGRNKNWGLQGDVHFAYQYQIVAETTVLENNGTWARFQTDFKSITQLRAVSEEEIQLAFSLDTPIIDLVWGAVEEVIPVPSLLSKPLRQLIKHDPRLRLPLTIGARILQKLGANVNVFRREDIEWATRVKELSGTTVYITYVRKIGVKSVEVKGKKHVPVHELENLAYNASLLMDYYLVKGDLDRKKGEAWEVPTREICGIVGIGYDAEIGGALKLQRSENIEFDGDDCVQLKVIGGELEAKYAGSGATHTLSVVPLEGEIAYSEKDRLVRRARGSWKMDKLEVGEDHLLFDTENVQNIKVTSVYEAKRLDTKRADKGG